MLISALIIFCDLFEKEMKVFGFC